MSSVPPARSSALAEPLWGPSLVTCIGVSAVVFACALAAARVASAERAQTPRTTQSSVGALACDAHDPGCHDQPQPEAAHVP